MMLNNIINTSILSAKSISVTLQEGLPQKQVKDKDSNSDTFLISLQEVPNASTPNASTNIARHPTGLTTKQVNENIQFLITNLKLELHSSANYFISSRTGSNPSDRYYPQLNGTFFVTGTTEHKEIIQSTIINFLNGEPVRSTSPTANSPLPHTLLLGQLRTFTANGFNFNANGTLTSPLHKNVTLHRQLDGSLWGSNNTTYRLASNNTSVEQQTETTPLPFTTFFSQMGIQPLRLTSAAPNSSQRLGAFLRPEDPGMFILEQNGTVFYTGREVPGQGRLGPYVYKQNSKGLWEIDQESNKKTPSPESVTLAEIKAFKLQNDKWAIISDDSNPEPYLITMLENGTVVRYREGSKDLRAFSYSPTSKSWTQLPDRYNSKTIPLPDGTWKYEGYFQFANGDSIYYLPDKTVMFLGAPSNDLSVFMVDDSGKIVRVGKRGTNPDNLETLFPAHRDVAIGIQTILKSRKARNWKSSAEDMLTQMKATPNYDGTWAYYGNNKSDHGDSMYLMPDGKFLMLDRHWGDCGVWINDGSGWKKQPKERAGVKLSNLDFKNIYPDDPMIAYGIERIIRSRENLGVGKDKPSESRPAITSMPYQGMKWSAHSANHRN